MLENLTIHCRSPPSSSFQKFEMNRRKESAIQSRQLYFGICRK